MTLHGNCHPDVVEHRVSLFSYKDEVLKLKPHLHVLTRVTLIRNRIRIKCVHTYRD